MLCYHPLVRFEQLIENPGRLAVPLCKRLDSRRQSPLQTTSNQEICPKSEPLGASAVASCQGIMTRRVMWPLLSQ